MSDSGATIASLQAQPRPGAQNRVVALEDPAGAVRDPAFLERQRRRQVLLEAEGVGDRQLPVPGQEQGHLELEGLDDRLERQLVELGQALGQHRPLHVELDRLEALQFPVDPALGADELLVLHLMPADLGFELGDARRQRLGVQPGCLRPPAGARPGTARW